uniref:TATA box-binding protein-associated factor RNA polymerase I subunit C n=2 Tax=Anopheles coluzzii TaxID=1518534 RepID=A0A6E8V3X3_ANOCL
MRAACHAHRRNARNQNKPIWRHVLATLFDESKQTGPQYTDGSAMIRKQRPKRSKPQDGKTDEAGDNVKKEPTKRKRERKSVPKNVLPAGQSEGAQYINPAIEPIVRHNVGNPSSTFLRRNPHHSILQLPLQPNVLTEDTLLTHFKTTRPFTATLPMPLHTTPGLGPSMPDLMVRAIHTKQAYERELHSLRKKYQKVATDRPLDLHGNGEDESVQHTVTLVYAALLDRDPDPYLKLETNYNPHFTGGTMVAVPGGAGSATIFKATGESLQDVEVLRIHCDGEGFEVGQVQACPMEMEGPLLELVPSEDGSVILARKRHVVIILREINVTPDSVEWRPVQHIFSVNPLASVCFVGGSTLTLCTTDYARQLQLWTFSDDEETCEDMVTLPQSVPKHSPTTKEERVTCHNNDHWSAVRCVDGHSLVACLDRTQLHLYTVVRNGENSPTRDWRLAHRGASDFSRWISPCEQCCALEVTSSEELLFIATTHKLIVAKIEESVDQPPTEESAQNGGDSFDFGNVKLIVKVLLVFAHNLKQCPVFLSHQWNATADHDTEHHFVLFGSHLPMSYGVASFTRSPNPTDLFGEPVYATQHYPYHPPTFHDTYKQAQAQGHCLSAYEPLRKRFYACQSGAALLRSCLPTDNGTERHEPRLYILLQTSAGDVVQQSLSYDFDRDEEKQHELKRPDVERQQHIGARLQQWHEKLVGQAGRIPYRATSFKTMQKFRDIFNCPVEGSELRQILYLPPEVKRKHRRKKREDEKEEDLNTEEEQHEDDEEDEGVWCPSQSVASGSSSAAEPSVIRRRRKYGRKAPPPWRQTLEDLQQYRDVLAPTLLSVWGVGNTDVPPQATNMEQIPTKLPPLADINERIGSWVTAATSEQLQRDTPETAEEDLELTVPNVTAAAKDEYGDMKEDADGDLFSQPLTQSQFISASQLSQQMVRSTVARPARKTYSKGF